MMISAVLDACVLYSASLRNFLLTLAGAKLFEPFWTEEIRDEWIRSLLLKRPNLKEKQERTRRKMDLHFPNAFVRGYESIIPTLALPDPKDRHVLAAAIHAKAECIVTFNLKDFPESALAPCQVKAISPDNFVLSMIEYNAKVFIETVARHRAGLSRPPQTADEYLIKLAKQRLPKTVAFLRRHETDI
jgi:predicted nucleic acid-binding protein